jgi:hypothetical protein
MRKWRYNSTNSKSQYYLNVSGQIHASSLSYPEKAPLMSAGGLAILKTSMDIS